MIDLMLSYKYVRMENIFKIKNHDKNSAQNLAKVNKIKNTNGQIQIEIVLKIGLFQIESHVHQKCLYLELIWSTLEIKAC